MHAKERLYIKDGHSHLGIQSGGSYHKCLNTGETIYILKQTSASAWAWFFTLIGWHYVWNLSELSRSIAFGKTGACETPWMSLSRAKSLAIGKRKTESLLKKNIIVKKTKKSLCDDPLLDSWVDALLISEKATNERASWTSSQGTFLSHSGSHYTAKLWKLTVG